MTMQARAQQTRRTIIEAAADAFVTRGFAGASLAEIADQAGVTKGALYFHFPSKAALASAMIEVQREANAELAERVDAYEGDRLELLVDLTRALGRRLVDDATLRAAMRLAVERGEVEDAVISETYTRWEQLVAEVVRAAKERREVAGHIDPGAVRAVPGGGVHRPADGVARRVGPRRPGRPGRGHVDAAAPRSHGGVTDRRVA